jgi:hypothetical protein
VVAQNRYQQKLHKARQAILKNAKSLLLPGKGRFPLLSFRYSLIAFVPDLYPKSNSR